MHFSLSCSAAIAAPRSIINTLNILCCLIVQQLKPQTGNQSRIGGLIILSENKSLLITVLLIMVHSLCELTFLISTLIFSQSLPEKIGTNEQPPSFPPKTSKVRNNNKKIKSAPKVKYFALGNAHEKYRSE